MSDDVIEGVITPSTNPGLTSGNLGTPESDFHNQSCESNGDNPSYPAKLGTAIVHTLVTRDCVTCCLIRQWLGKKLNTVGS